MEWKNRAWQFYRLAAEKELSESDYRNWLTTHLSTASLSDIFEFMREFETSSFFKTSDFLDTIYQHFQINEFLNRDIEDLSLKVQREIYAGILDMWTKDPNPLLGFGPASYLRYFEDRTRFDINEETQRRAKVKVLNNIQELSQSSDKMAQVTAIRQLEYLYTNCYSFGKKFILNFAKHLGPEIYAQLRAQNKDLWDLKDILSKDKLNIHDIAAIYYINPIFNYDDIGTYDLTFAQLLERADAQAQEYMRGWIYAVSSFAPLFILDETNQPININYENIKWPRNFSPVRLQNLSLSDKEKQAWWQLLQDFKIVPQ